MNDLVAEILLFFSAFATIFVMVIIIVKERSRQKTVDTKKAKKHVKRKLHNESERLYIN